MCAAGPEADEDGPVLSGQDNETGLIAGWLMLLYNCDSY